MLNKEELRRQVIQYFRSVGSGENIVQCIKEALFLHQKFSPVQVFEVLSRGRQRLTAGDIRNYLIQHNISFSEDELRYYLSHNGFKNDATLNDFLEAMIPYNADVVRQFKKEYTDRLNIHEFDPQIQYILNQLFDNEIKFYRSLINIREGISSIASKKDIEALIKEDLVLKSNPRESKKYHQAFQNKNHQLGFHELRKFLELWLSSKEIIHQFYLLNVMRHLKSNQPFDRIVWKQKKPRSSKSAQKRPVSAKPAGPQHLTNQKLKEHIGSHDFEPNFSRTGDKFSSYKKEVINQYIKDRQSGSDIKRQSPGRAPRGLPPPEETGAQEALRRSKYHRESKGIDGSLLLDILEQIVMKEERLQKLRKNLAKSADFNLINLFKLIDVRSKGFITCRDVSQFTAKGRIQFNYMVNFYAREPEKLRFHEFCLIFRPLSRQLNEAIDSRQEHRVPNPFKNETTKLIIEVLSLTAEMHASINATKQRMAQEGSRPEDYWRFVDLQEKGYISAGCFQKVLSENNVFVDDKDLKCLMKLFRKKVDERIALGEFRDFLDLR